MANSVFRIQKLIISFCVLAFASGKEIIFGLDQVSLLARNGYHSEEHFVRTTDGYVLSLFHIEKNIARDLKVTRNRPVLLQAGLLDSSKSLLNLEKDSLALMLVEAGFDVWLGNNRGNAWSKRHVDIDVSEPGFWEFSWDEMALYDLPSEVDYILNYTQHESLGYVGHSQGNMQMFAALAERKNDPRLAALAGKIDLFVALAPVAYLRHLGSVLLKFLAATPLPEVIEGLGVHDFAPTPEQLRDIFPEVCKLLKTGCKDILALGFGPTEHIEKEDYEQFVTDWPSGTSAHNMMHFIQMIRRDLFSKYDYGPKKNLRLYGSRVAPKYSLKEFATARVPTMLVSGSHDTMASPKDVQRMREEINATVVKDLYIEGYAHMDFLWARDARKLIYPDIIAELDRYTRIIVPEDVIVSEK